MRRLLFLLFIPLVGIVALNDRQPGATPITPVATPTVTPLPDNFTLIPTFVPSYPCELQNVEVYDDQLCRYETVSEKIAASGNGVLFIQHDYHMGQGCWGTVNQDIHELRACTQSSGAISTLTQNLSSDVVPSPDGQWFAFASTIIDNSIMPHVYRIRSNGHDLQLLDTHGFPEEFVGSVQINSWSADGLWLNITGWDGLNGHYSDRLKADGSGVYEAGAHITDTPQPTFPPQPTTAPPTAGAPLIGTPPYPQPTATPLSR